MDDRNVALSCRRDGFDPNVPIGDDGLPERMSLHVERAEHGRVADDPRALMQCASASAGGRGRSLAGLC